MSGRKWRGQFAEPVTVMPLPNIDMTWGQLASLDHLLDMNTSRYTRGLSKVWWKP
jgi:hypothetical protein